MATRRVPGCNLASFSNSPQFLKRLLLGRKSADGCFIMTPLQIGQGRWSAIHAMWLAIEPVDMRAGADRLLARAVRHARRICSGRSSKWSRVDAGASGHCDLQLHPLSAPVRRSLLGERGHSQRFAEVHGRDACTYEDTGTSGFRFIGILLKVRFSDPVGGGGDAVTGLVKGRNA